MSPEQILTDLSAAAFETLCLTIFRRQAAACSVYRDYISCLGIDPQTIECSKDIPFLPISFFKTHAVTSSEAPAAIVFSSSGTTGMVQSRHLVTDLTWYEQSYLSAFGRFYGNPADYCILALLPAYLEREGSSLIYMADDLLSKSTDPRSGYFLHNHTELAAVLEVLQQGGQKTILLGVTYALLDFIEAHSMNFPELIVMETGGMKGRRKEMVREELHDILCAGFGVHHIHSEYGMTELLSQAYSSGEGRFVCPPWMQVCLRDTNDPLSPVSPGTTGGINVIDLANYNSCSFISTQDLGRLHADGSFEVLGRFDHSDIRGCNLLVQ
ncbi:acyl transferase [Pedobacter yulinensis]|uniref:Acyl transferase n=1 Tax=Pedobacter yulinensis TaxID=2126353 RepID=A0A2T3HHU8_9SPHI|nr:acyl transferase [Pedobacter yulinensis]PST82015.1 acyl transferase [Pedobacter yulinensis]